MLYYYYIFEVFNNTEKYTKMRTKTRICFFLVYFSSTIETRVTQKKKRGDEIIIFI